MNLFNLILISVFSAGLLVVIILAISNFKKYKDLPKVPKNTEILWNFNPSKANNSVGGYIIKPYSETTKEIEFLPTDRDFDSDPETIKLLTRRHLLKSLPLGDFSGRMGVKINLPKYVNELPKELRNTSLGLGLATTILVENTELNLMDAMVKASKQQGKLVDEYMMGELSQKKLEEIREEVFSLIDVYLKTKGPELLDKLKSEKKLEEKNG